MPKLKGGLGKGLDALFADTGIGSDGVTTVKLSEIEPNSGQPRKSFDEAALSELAHSIALHGVLQPLLVRPMASGMYQIVAGERRWRAARIAGLAEVPVVVREMDDAEAAKLAMIENLQREDLNPLEEAEGYRALMEKHSLTQEQVAEAVGKGRPTVANSLRILKLPPEVLSLVGDGSLSAGHAKALLAVEDGARLVALAEEAVKNGYTVRQVERLAAKPAEAAAPKQKPADSLPRDKWYAEMQAAMTGEFGRPIKIVEGKKGGVLQIPFYSKEELYDIGRKLSK